MGYPLTDGSYKLIRGHAAKRRQRDCHDINIALAHSFFFSYVLAFRSFDKLLNGEALQNDAVIDHAFDGNP